jgi:hypothetical protein
MNDDHNQPPQPRPITASHARVLDALERAATAAEHRHVRAAAESAYLTQLFEASR